MALSETKDIFLPILLLDVQCPVCQWSDKNMFATANVQEAYFLRDYAIFVANSSLSPHIMFLIVFLYQYFLFYPSLLFQRINHATWL
jgi:hypothetical protein